MKMTKELMEKKWAAFDRDFDNQDELMEKEIGCVLPIEGHTILLKAIILPDKIRGFYVSDEQRARVKTEYDVGKVIGMGPECYRDSERFPYGPLCRVGDWAEFKPFEKIKRSYNNHLCFVVSDDRIMYPIKDPKTIIPEIRKPEDKINDDVILSEEEFFKWIEPRKESLYE